MKAMSASSTAAAEMAVRLFPGLKQMKTELSRAAEINITAVNDSTALNCGFLRGYIGELDNCYLLNIQSVKKLNFFEYGKYFAGNQTFGTTKFINMDAWLF